MCGRYTGNDDCEEMSEIYERASNSFPNVEMKHGEIFPTDTAPILFGGDMKAVPAKWGYPKYNEKGVIINARAETVCSKPVFRESILLRRCIIPTTGYIEWDAEKTKFKINYKNEKMLYLGGFCQRFGDGARFVILTTRPNESVKGIHFRMPLIVGPDSEMMKRWNTDNDWAINYLNAEMPELTFTAI